MKILNTTALSILLSFTAVPAFSYAEELPHDVNLLQRQREVAINKIDAKYRIELERLKVKYTKLGDLDSANSINRILKGLKPKLPSIEASKKSTIIGDWEFDSKGRKRNFTFKVDNYFTGEKLKDGSNFSGKWRLEENRVILWDAKEKKDLPHHLKVISAEELIFFGPAGKMSGKRA